MYMQAPNEVDSVLDGVWVSDTERAELQQYGYFLCLHCPVSSLIEWRYLIHFLGHRRSI